MSARRAGTATALCLLAALAARAPAQEAEVQRLAALAKIKSLHARLQFSPRDSYLNYAIATIARRAELDLKREGIDFPLVPVVTDRPAERVDLLGFASGALALHESVQLTELLGPERKDSGGRVPLAELAPPVLSSLDFAALLERLERAAPAPGVEDEARFAPADWIYARFACGRDLLALLGETELWLRHLLTMGDSERGDASFLWRAFGKLGLPDPRQFPAFYEALPAPFAVAVSDPFLREGTDVVVVFSTSTPALPLLLGRLAPASGALHHTAERGGFVLLATSSSALECALALAQEESLAASADFRYARALLPAGEDCAASLFLSEACLRGLVGPRLRVLEARRVRCASHLRTLLNAALLFAEESARPPASLEELAASGHVKEAVLLCPHGGAYGLENGFCPSCSVHGRLDHLTPLFRLALSEVSEEEASAYRRFTRAYENLWRRYFDPVAVTVRRDGPSWQADMIVLPLAENSLYRGLGRVAGGAPVEGASAFLTPSSVLAASIKIDRGLRESFLALLRRWNLAEKPGRAGADEVASALHDGFSDEVSVALLDDDMLFDFDLPAFAGEALRSGLTRDVFLAPLLAGASLPVVVACGVRDPCAARRFLDALHAHAVRQGARPRLGRLGFHFQAYELPGDAALSPTRVLALELFSFEFRLFYALRQDALFVATRPDVLARALESAVRAASAEPFNLRVSLHPGQWQAVAGNMLLDYEEAARRMCMRSLIELEPFQGAPDTDAADVLGLRLACPDGGGRQPASDGGLRCSLHGEPRAPLQTAAPSSDNAATRLLAGLERVTFSLRFIPEGIHTTIRVDRRSGD